MIGLLCSAFAPMGGIIPPALALRAAEEAYIPRGAMDAPAWALVHAHR